MAAKPIFIWWDEFERRDLPRLCMYCGAKARWERCTFEKINRVGHTKIRHARKVVRPVCSDHDASAATAEFNEKGLWLEDGDEEFVAALKKHRKKEIASWKQEGETGSGDNASLPPGLRKTPKMPPKQTAKPFLIILAIFLVVLLVPGCLAAGAVGFFLLRPQ